MSYGILNFKSQNGKPGIFFVPEKKKPIGTYGYKSKDVKIPIRKEPWNKDQEETEPPPEPPKPKVDFIKRNRLKIANKNTNASKKTEELKPLKKDNHGITLTQEQLNAILSSVGKVATGKEENVKISIDSHDHSITIESPRRKGSDYDEPGSDYLSDDGHRETKPRRSHKNSNREEETSIYALLDGADQKMKKKGRNSKEEQTPAKGKVKKKVKYVDSEDEIDRLDTEGTRKDGNTNNNKVRNRESTRDRSRENHRSRDMSRERYRSRERETTLDSMKSDDSELRYQKSVDKLRQREVSSKQPKKKIVVKAIDVKRSSSVDSGRYSDYESSKSKSKKSSQKHTSKERKVNNSDEKESAMVEKSVRLNIEPETKVITPREVAGIPLALPWKHMTKAERRRLMMARIETEAALKEKEAQKWKLEHEEMQKKEAEIRGRIKREMKISEENSDTEDRRNHRHSPDNQGRRHRGEGRKKEKISSRHRYDSESNEESDTEYRARKDRHRQSRNRDDSEDRSRHRRKQYSSERHYSPERDSSEDRHMHRGRRKHRTPSPSPDREDGLRADDVGSPTSKKLTLGEKKRLQWEKERMEASLKYDPWGKPGAGAPIRTKSGNVAADYRARQEGDIRDSQDIEQELEQEDKGNQRETSRKKSRSRDRKSSRERSKEHRRHSRERERSNSKRRSRERSRGRRDGSGEEIRRSKEVRERSRDKPPQDEAIQPSRVVDSNVPAAMRTSIVFGGQVAPNTENFETAKERERKQWLADLDKQREERRLMQAKELQRDVDGTDTWADKFSAPRRPAGLPEQAMPADDNLGQMSPRDLGVESGRVNSAPNQSISFDQEEKTYLRGQNVFIDPVTRKEQEEKRKRQMEYQNAVLEQVREKERIKQVEREKKMKEDLEEEMKLKAERDRMQRQFDQEQMKIKMKEAKRQHEVEQLKAAMDEAHEKAQREKIARKVQHLEEGGHDTSHLIATLQETSRSMRDTLRAKITPRNETNRQQEPVPGLQLDLSPRANRAEVYYEQPQEKPRVSNVPYTENRILTPSQFRHTRSSKNMDEENLREFGTQTVDLRDNSQREPTEVNIIYNASGKRVRVKSATKEEKARGKPVQAEEVPRGRKPTRNPKTKANKEKPLWNYKNPKYVKPVKNSEKDLNYSKKRAESETRREKRERQLLSLVEANRDRIPTERYTPSHSRNCSPASDKGGVSPREVIRQKHRSGSQSPVRVDGVIDQSTHRMPSNSPGRSGSPAPQVSNRPKSPPVPALRYGNTSDRQLTSRKYEDIHPFDVPVKEGDFVPIMRTVDILDPAKASSPLPISREASVITNARKAYLKGMQPGNYGKKFEKYGDRMKAPVEQNPMKDPIFNPALVKETPTHRQDAILQQLSSLKMNLMQKQRELETFSPTDFE